MNIDTVSSTVETTTAILVAVSLPLWLVVEECLHRRASSVARRRLSAGLKHLRTVRPRLPSSLPRAAPTPWDPSAPRSRHGHLGFGDQAAGRAPNR